MDLPDGPPERLCSRKQRGCLCLATKASSRGTSNQTPSTRLTQCAAVRILVYLACDRPRKNSSMGNGGM
jgi:hypothetical protein